MNIRDEGNRRAQEALRLARIALDEKALSGDVPDRFLFLTISGSHIYGFPSPDSDLDMRGAHVVSLREAIGLVEFQETYECDAGHVHGVPLDCVTHDVKKYLRLLTKKNGYVLEQVFSPLVVWDGGHLEELRTLARDALTRHHVHHYKGFFRT